MAGVGKEKLNEKNVIISSSFHIFVTLGLSHEKGFLQELSYRRLHLFEPSLFWFASCP